MVIIHKLPDKLREEMQRGLSKQQAVFAVLGPLPLCSVPTGRLVVMLGCIAEQQQCTCTTSGVPEKVIEDITTLHRDDLPPVSTNL